jgi:beta-xylosidase
MPAGDPLTGHVAPVETTKQNSVSGQTASRRNLRHRTDVAVGDETTRRPVRYADIGLPAFGDHLLNPACVVVPFMMSSIDATDSVVTTVPENR